LKTSQPVEALFLIKNKGSLSLTNLNLSATALSTKALAATDTTASSEHFNFKMKNVAAKNLSGCAALFEAAKSTFADSIVIENCEFTTMNNGIILADEKDNKGYYNAEKLRIAYNTFKNGKGVLLNIYRGGNDESTLGPNLAFVNNKISDYNSNGESPLVDLTGVQKTKISANTFTNCASGSTLIQYKDVVRARHFIAKNVLVNSGSINKNQFVTDLGNMTRSH
jgi:poly(beta-D-mannuronate) lyase